MSTTELTGTDGRPGVQVPAGSPHYERRWLALGVTLIAQMMLLLDATIVNVALPSVGFWWAAGAFWAGAVISGALIRRNTRFHHEAGQPEPLDDIADGLV